MRRLIPAILLTACIRSAPTPINTSRDITPEDLRQRLYLIADDSMMGRESGSEGDFKTATYIASEFGRLGLTPGGENGTYFQTVPFWRSAVDPSSHLEVGRTTLTLGADFLPANPAAPPIVLNGTPTIYDDLASDSSRWIPEHAADGKVVILDLPRGMAIRSANVFNGPRWRGAVAIAIGGLESLGGEQVARFRDGRPVQDTSRNPRALPLLYLTRRPAAAILGADA